MEASLGPGGVKGLGAFRRRHVRSCRTLICRRVPTRAERETEAAEVGETDLEARRPEGEEATARSVNSWLQRERYCWRSRSEGLWVSQSLNAGTFVQEVGSEEG